MNFVKTNLENFAQFLNVVLYSLMYTYANLQRGISCTFCYTVLLGLIDWSKEQVTLND